MKKEHPAPGTQTDINTETRLKTAEENREAAITLVKKAHYSIDIFTPDLEAEIYNNREFEQAVFELARRHHSTRVRILCRDSEKAVKQGHCLIRLAQTLTSSIAIHKPSEEHQGEQDGFLVIDKTGLLYRLPANRQNYHSTFSLNAPQRAAKLMDFFNEAWEHSTPDMQARRIYV